MRQLLCVLVFFFNDTATTEIYPLSLHDALPIWRSGRQYALPVQYAGAGDQLIVRPQRWQHATWWRNFRMPQPVTVRLAGRLHEGTARVLDPGDPDWPSARQTYATRWRRPARGGTGPLVVITLRP